MANNGVDSVRALLGLREARSYTAVVSDRHSLEPVGGVGLESITLGTTDGDDIPCLYLTPATPKPWPRAMIALHQHAGRFDLGKSEPAGLQGDPTLAFGLRLAQSGFPTLVPDLLGFEDRQRPGDDPAAAERFDAFFRIAEGSNLQAKHTRDVAAATNWLLQNTEISGPIGVMAHSLGGQVALFSLAFDDRLRAGVISCGLGTLQSFLVEHISHNPAWFVPGLLKHGDIQSVAAGITERRVLVTAGANDSWFPAYGVHDVVQAFEPGVCDFQEEESAYELSEETLAMAVSWLKQNL